MVGGATVTGRYYLSGFEYDNSKALNLIHMEEGDITVSSGPVFTYEYHFKDHLGSTRDSLGVPLLTQSVDYYPFGMQFSPASIGGDNKYLFGGKELQDENLGGVNLDWYDFHNRFLDPQIGRWTTIDPAAELGRRWSPYSYTFDNPIRFTDPDGMWPNGPGGFPNPFASAIDELKSYANEAYGQAKDFINGGWRDVAAFTDLNDATVISTTLTRGSNAININRTQATTIDKVAAFAGAILPVVSGTAVAKALGIVYKRTNPETGGKYIGKVKNESRFLKRQTEHDKSIGVKHEYEIIDRGELGTDLSVKEETAIRKEGGPSNKSTKGTLENKRHEMNDERYKNAGGTEEKKY